MRIKEVSTLQRVWLGPGAFACVSGNSTFLQHRITHSYAHNILVILYTITTPTTKRTFISSAVITIACNKRDQKIKYLFVVVIECRKWIVPLKERNGEDGSLLDELCCCTNLNPWCALSRNARKCSCTQSYPLQREATLVCPPVLPNLKRKETN
jgi:hypothetical protein